MIWNINLYLCGWIVIKCIEQYVITDYNWVQHFENSKYSSSEGSMFSQCMQTHVCIEKWYGCTWWVSPVTTRSTPNGNQGLGSHSILFYPTSSGRHILWIRMPLGMMNWMRRRCMGGDSYIWSKAYLIAPPHRCRARIMIRIRMETRLKTWLKLKEILEEQLNCLHKS